MGIKIVLGKIGRAVLKFFQSNLVSYIEQYGEQAILDLKDACLVAARTAARKDISGDEKWDFAFNLVEELAKTKGQQFATHVIEDFLSSAVRVVKTEQKTEVDTTK